MRNNCTIIRAAATSVARTKPVLSFHKKNRGINKSRRPMAKERILISTFV